MSGGSTRARSRYPPEPVDVAALVERARNTFLSGGGRHGVSVDLPPDLPRAMADRRRIVQVLNNLFSNAARHAPESSPIRVTAVREGVHVAISVADEGRGVAPERLPHLFRKHGGIAGGDGEGALGAAGLGLAICKGLVEAHGGAHPGGERGRGSGRRGDVHAAGGRSGRRGRRGGPRPDRPARTPGRAGADTRPRGGRRPEDAALRARRARRLGIRPGGDRRSGGGVRPHPDRAAPAGPARPDAPRDRRHRADGAGSRARRPAGDLHLRLRPRRDRRAGAGGRRRRLHRQAVLADGAEGAHPGRAAQAGRARALSPGRAGDPLRGNAG